MHIDTTQAKHTLDTGLHTSSGEVCLPGFLESGMLLQRVANGFCVMTLMLVIAACAPTIPAPTPTPEPPHVLLNGTWLMGCPPPPDSSVDKVTYTIDFDKKLIIVMVSGVERQRSRIKLIGEEPDKVVFQWEGLIEGDRVTAVFLNRDQVRFGIPGSYNTCGERVK